MVPHRRILQAISLVTQSIGKGPGQAAKIADGFGVKFPVEFSKFLTKEVYNRLPAPLEAWFRTMDATAVYDYRPLHMAAGQLGLTDLVNIGDTGPAVILPKPMPEIRKHDSLRKFVEGSILAAIPSATIASDVNRTFGLVLSEEDVVRYAEVFVDREYTEGDNWLLYACCIGAEEAKFKRQLIGQHPDFVRWRLGARYVELDAEVVLNRLISDSYFTERVIKAEAGNMGRALDKNDMARIKMERDTLFKAIDRRTKLREVSGGDESKAALAMISGVVARYESFDDLMSREELGHLG
jgi:hypothetical protein